MRKNDDNKKFWDKVARLYTPLQGKSNRKNYDIIIDKCKSYLNENCNVLEIGCGTGQFSYKIANYVKNLVATDFSQKMINQCDKAGKENLTFKVEDATALSFNDCSYDVVLIANVLHIVPNPESILFQIQRVLKNGGILLAPTFMYEGKINKFRMWILSKVGFKTYHKWTLNEYSMFLQDNKFHIIEKQLLKGKPLPEGFVVCKVIK